MPRLKQNCVTSVRKPATRTNGPASICDPKPPERRRRPHGPKYWRTVWKRAVEEFYGDTTAALRWMQSPSPELGGIPVQIARTPEGRTKVLRELNRLYELKANTRPRTVWRTCRAFYPSPVNGDLLFRNTQIPAAGLFEAFAQEKSINDFLRENPEITRKQVDSVLQDVICDLCDF